MTSASRVGWLTIGLTAIGCAAHPPPPTVTGAELYANVEALRATGQITVRASSGPLVVRRDQVLVSSSQIFVIAEIVEHCRGGALEHDTECTLALLGDQRFEVRDEAPRLDAPAGGSGLGRRWKAGLVALAIGGGLGYGLAECSFEGCGEVFGAALVVDAVFLLFLTASR